MIPRERTLPQQIFLRETNALGHGALMKSPEDHSPLSAAETAMVKFTSEVHSKTKSLKLYS